jgi:hypothetical protein
MAELRCYEEILGGLSAIRKGCRQHYTSNYRCTYYKGCEICETDSEQVRSQVPGGSLRESEANRDSYRYRRYTTAWYFTAMDVNSNATTP